MKNKSIGILLVLVFISVFSVKAQNKYQASDGFVSFFSSAPIEDIYAENKNVKSLVDLSSLEFAFVIPISGFTFKKSLMQKHFNDKYLESDKYPNAIFTGILIPKLDMERRGVKEFMAKGEIKMHGVSQKINIPAKINFGKNNFVVKSEFILRPKDFNIKIPRILIKNIAEEVLVKVNLVYEVMP